jgi:Sulfotransferase family
MLSERHRCIFVHIPKTGGTSLELFFTGHDWITRDAAEYAIYRAERPLYNDRFGGTLCAGNPGYFRERVREKHATQAELMERLGRAVWNASFCFTFVRNPWVRLLSVYDHGLRDAPGRMPPRLADWLGQKQPLDHMGMPVFRDWVCDWNALDFVGRFERIEKDFAQLLAILRLPPAPLPVERHGGTGQHDPAAYDEEARRLVAERCGAEIERFDYRFEDAFSRR